MNVRREHSLDTLAELASSDQREIRILDVFSGPGGVGFALRELFTAPGVNGWFCGVDETDYAERYPGEFRHLDARDPRWKRSVSTSRSTWCGSAAVSSVRPALTRSL